MYIDYVNELYDKAHENLTLKQKNRPKGNTPEEEQRMKDGAALERSLDHDLKALLRDCMKGTDPENVNNAISTAVGRFEVMAERAWHMLYLLPTIPLEDAPEKWAICENTPLQGRTFRVSKDDTVVAELIERHTDTIDGTPGCVYRLNGDTRLAFMLYGTTVIEYEMDTNNPNEMQVSNTYSCASFIDSWPFTVPYPCVVTLIHAINKENGEHEDYGFVSDIRNLFREEISAEDMKGRFFTPEGTSMYPKAYGVLDEKGHPIEPPTDEHAATWVDTPPEEIPAE